LNCHDHPENDQTIPASTGAVIFGYPVVSLDQLAQVAGIVPITHFNFCDRHAPEGTPVGQRSTAHAADRPDNGDGQCRFWSAVNLVVAADNSDDHTSSTFAL
jgi:hypothetical protein